MSSKHLGGSITPQVLQFNAFSAASEEEEQFKPSATEFRSETPVTFRSISVESLNSLQMAQMVNMQNENEEDNKNETSDSKSIGIESVDSTRSNVL